MSRRVAGAAIAVLVLAVVAAGIAAAVPIQHDLVVQRADTGGTLLDVPVTDGTNVTLAYHHSVEHSRVLDVYEVRGEELLNTRMVFADYGWGYPAEANVTIENGTFVYRIDPPRDLHSFYVKPGRIAGHELYVDGHRYDLVAMSNATTVRLSVRSRTVVQELLG